MTQYRCCICRKELDVDDDSTVVVKTFFDKDFAHASCENKLKQQKS